MSHVHFSAPTSGAITANPTPAQQLNARFTAIYGRHQARITSLVLSQVRGNDHHLAEDLTATAFYRAWLDLHKCRATTDTGVYAWLAQIARHTVMAHYRLARNTRETAADFTHWAYADREFAPSGAVLAPAAGLPSDEEGDGSCNICGFWKCRCGTGRHPAATGIIARRGTRTVQIVRTPAGGRGTIRTAVTR